MDWPPFERALLDGIGEQRSGDHRGQSVLGTPAGQLVLRTQLVSHPLRRIRKRISGDSEDIILVHLVSRADGVRAYKWSYGLP